MKNDFSHSLETREAQQKSRSPLSFVALFEMDEYLMSGKRLLKESAAGVSPFDGFIPCQPTVTEHIAFSPFASEASDLTKCVCVLVAGGIGERLGYSGIKIELPTEISSGICFLEMYCEYMISLNGQWLCIMTSDDTDNYTKALLEANNYFGLDSNKVSIIKQEKVVCFADADANIAYDDHGQAIRKPHGHGDIHSLIYKERLTERWLENGLEFALFFQDTNPMCFRTLPVALRVSQEHKLDVNFVAIPRKARAATGALMRLRSSSREMTVNVEYNYLDHLLKLNGLRDYNDASGYSLFPGNNNELVFELKSYSRHLNGLQGNVCPEFVNPKYVDDTRTTFKTPTRLECMMQDYPQSLPSEAQVGITLFSDSPFSKSVTHPMYAPAKNNIEDAAVLSLKGIPDASPGSSELAIYACNAQMLKGLGCHIADPVPSHWGGIEQEEWCHIVFHPSFLPKFSQLPFRFMKPDDVVISAKSTLVVRGRHVVFSGRLELDGALIVCAHPDAYVTLESVQVSNLGWRFSPASKDDTEIHRIRGFSLKRSSMPTKSDDSVYVLNFEISGVYSLKVKI